MFAFGVKNIYNDIKEYIANVNKRRKT